MSNINLKEIIRTISPILDISGDLAPLKKVKFTFEKDNLVINCKNKYMTSWARSILSSTIYKNFPEIQLVVKDLSLLKPKTKFKLYRSEVKQNKQLFVPNSLVVSQLSYNQGAWRTALYVLNQMSTTKDKKFVVKALKLRNIVGSNYSLTELKKRVLDPLQNNKINIDLLKIDKKHNLKDNINLFSSITSYKEDGYILVKFILNDKLDFLTRDRLFVKTSANILNDKKKNSQFMLLLKQSFARFKKTRNHNILSIIDRSTLGKIFFGFIKTQETAVLNNILRDCVSSLHEKFPNIIRVEIKKRGKKITHYVFHISRKIKDINLGDLTEEDKALLLEIKECFNLQYLNRKNVKSILKDKILSSRLVRFFSSQGREQDIGFFFKVLGDSKIKFNHIYYNGRILELSGNVA